MFTSNIDDHRAESTDSCYGVYMHRYRLIPSISICWTNRIFMFDVDTIQIYLIWMEDETSTEINKRTWLAEIVFILFREEEEAVVEPLLQRTSSYFIWVAREVSSNEWRVSTLITWPDSRKPFAKHRRRRMGFFGVHQKNVCYPLLEILWNLASCCHQQGC